MKSPFAALLRAELLLHRRSLRSWLALGLYPLLTLLPWPLARGGFLNAELLIGPTTGLALAGFALPYTTLLLAAGLAGRGQGRSSREELLPLLASSPFSSSALVASRAGTLALLFLAATALPFLILFSIATADGAAVDPLAYLLAWLLRAWPMALVLGWTWLALTLIGGSDLAAGLLLWLASLTFDQIASLPGFEASFAWRFFAEPQYLRQLLFVIFNPQRVNDFWWILPGLVASEGPADPLLATERSLVDFLPPLGLALFLLAFAAQRLGRCRPDLTPRDFSKAPSLGRLRQFLTFDAGLSRGEKALAWLGLLLALAALLPVEARARRFFAWAEQRYAAETGELGAPTDPSLALVEAAVEADLGSSALFPSGRLEGRFRQLFENRGGAPQERLAFRLDPWLTLDSPAAQLDGAPVGLRFSRHHDRLLVELARPVPPGGRLTFTGGLAGRPSSPLLGIVTFYATDSFVESWESLRNDPRSRQATRFATAELHPAISRNQVRLEGDQLMPLPRYTPWRLPASQAPPRGEDPSESDSTPAEESREPANLEITLRAPAEWLLFDSCAQASEPEGGRSRLRGGCRLRPGDYVVRGGALSTQQVGQVTLASLPGHAAVSQPLLEALATIRDQSEKSWPGAPPLGRLVVVEESKFYEPTSLPIGGGSSDLPAPLRARGQLLEFPEKRLVLLSRFESLELAGPLLVDRLLQNRRLAPEDSWAISTLVQQVVAARLGLSPGRAVISGPPWNREAYRKPLRVYRGWELRHGAHRLGALAADLGGRLGADALQRGLADFLEAQHAAPGTLFELLATLEKRSGQSLAQFRADFIEQGGLPELALAEVRSQGAEGGLFEVSGRLENSGSGEVVCPLVLRTDRSEIWQKVRVGGGGETPFRFSTSQRPVLVELDPGATCLRFVSSGASAAEKVQL